ncbi:sigma-E factor negative regulatory protein [Spongiibacter sp.]|uniref:sigma-E factor negative regulatory protein n=1 Tax=Spongiibacter sp. TaxID=2024860 RepID=UPI003567CB49
MKETVRESLSALMDGEASDMELRRLLRSGDTELRKEWAAFHRNQQLMHDGELAFAELDVSERVMAAIDQQPALRSSGGWRQALTGVAVAASVAAVVVFAGSERMLGGDKVMFAAAKEGEAAVSGGRVYPAQMSPATGGVAVNATATAIPSMSPAVRSDADKRFDTLLRKHTERASLNSGQGFVSYARVVSQESK